MATFSIIGIIILVIILLSFGKILSFALKAVFYFLLVSFIIMLFTGVGFGDLIDGITTAALWVF